MPIRLRSSTANLGRIQSTLANVTAALSGTRTVPASRTGTIGAMLSPFVGALTGQFQSNANRTGTIAATLANTTAAITGTFAQSVGGVEAALEADWQARISGDGVVWHHDFRSESEVNAFRWQNSFGNDPDSLSTLGTYTRHALNDGITGGGCLEIERPIGSTDPPGWWRPFAPLASPGNGKDEDDPAAGGTLTVRNWTGLSSTTANQNFKKGYYANADYDGAHSYGGTNWTDDDFDGNEFYIQYRFKVSQGRSDSNLVNGFGKYGFIATTATTLKQELVIQSCKSRWLWYTNFGSSPDTGGSLGDGSTSQPGGDYSSCQSNGTGCWLYEMDEWVTFLIHVIPGHEGVQDTQLEVFVARDGETEYETLYSGINTIEYTQGSSVGHPRAYNAFQPSAYCNGSSGNSTTSWFQRYDQIIFSKQPIQCPQYYAATTPLGIAAQSLAPGQSVLLATPGLTYAMLEQAGDDIVQWGSSAYWVDDYGEFGFQGKRQGSGAAYRWVTYTESTDTWSIDRTPWSTANVSGHAWDFNTADPATGDVYFLQYNSLIVHKWTRATQTWSQLPAMPSPQIGVATISWFPGVGLIYARSAVIRRFNVPTNAWVTLGTFANLSGDTHMVSEYNPYSDVLLCGSGNSDVPIRKMTSAEVITEVAYPPFNIGSSASQGVFCADPATDAFLAWQKSTSNWTQFRVSTGAWTTLTQSTGDGSVPQNGLPNFRTTDSVIAAPINRYGVTMWLESVDSQTPRVWLYRHA